MYVIIGGSAAAISCIAGIRSIDTATPITLITEETDTNYARPMISYWLCGKTTAENMHFRAPSFYADNGVTVLCGNKAEAIDAKNKTVTLNTGKHIAYSKLLLATGSRPFVPPVEGLESVSQMFTFMTLESANALAAALQPESRVLIVGAGLTGLKCAEGIHGRCGKITVVDFAPRILPAVLDAKAAAMVQTHMEKAGIAFRLSTGVASFEKDVAKLQTGEEIPFDILVMAVGVRPNTQLLADIGGAVNKGIIINAHCQTSLPDIYAAGDCAEGTDVQTAAGRILPLWPVAMAEGRCAGINMAGGTADNTDNVAVNATGLFGLHMITAGVYDGEDYIEQSQGSYKRLITKDGVLRGMIMLGDVARAGIYTNLIRTAEPLADIDFELIKKAPQLMAFSRSQRAQQLGGEV